MRDVTPAGAATVAAYLTALATIQLDGRLRGAALGSSPAEVATGHVMPLLTSGLVVDGPAWGQIALLTAVLVIALSRLGAGRLWTVAAVAHVGATVVAYAGIGLLALVHRSLVAAALRAPDYGVSVVLTGELGALALAGDRRRALVAGTVVLAGAMLVAFLVAGTVGPDVLAGAEHLLGFSAGAAAIACGRCAGSSEPAAVPASA